MMSVSSNIVSVDELSNVPVLNQSALDQIKNIDDEDLKLTKELFGIFETDTPIRLSAIKAALESNDMTRARDLSHAMKGSCGTMGAARARAISAMIEARCNKGGQAEATHGELVGELGELFDRLQNAFGEAREALRKYIDGSQSV
jgi:HPt (histidine-containing phosphotransfer) domain-containing protein